MMESLCFLAQENYEIAYRGFDKITEFTALFEGVAVAKDMPKRDREKAERLAKDAIEYMDITMIQTQTLIGALRKAEKKEPI